MPEQTDVSVEAPHPHLNVWSTERIGEAWFVVRRGVWEASVRITPSKDDDLRRRYLNDQHRAEQVCALLNRIAG